jgi:hypothetical protein
MTKPTGVKRTGNPTDFETFLTWEALVSILSYDPATGEFRWRAFRTNPQRIKEGQLAGQGKPGEYGEIMILGRKFQAHRLAWFYMKKRWPTALVDHKNGSKSDNRWENLREASRSQNGHNRSPGTNNKSGFVGVYPHGKKWRATVRVSGKSIHLGTFATREDAIKARQEFNVANFGEFARSA